MRQHRLLVFQRIGKRKKTKLALLALVVFAIGLYDQFTEFLGDYWLAWWAAFFLTMTLWVYYAIMMRRASIQVRAKFLRLQGPILGYNISYGRIHSVTSGKLEQHYKSEDLKKSELSVIEPFAGQTCLFIELTSYPKSFRWRKLWFPRILFGTTRRGLICHVDDWMALSRDIESARSYRYALIQQQRHNDRGSLARTILADDIRF